MKRIVFAIAAVALFGTVIATGQSKIVGAYQVCEMACQTIQIRSDHTFERVLDGDLFNNQRTIGKWIALAGNRIRAVGPKPNGPPQVEEEEAPRDNFTKIVIDFAGAVLPQAELHGIANGKPFRCVTNNDGACEIPICNSFIVARAHYSGEYNVKSASSRIFRVKLSAAQMPDDVIDDVWVIENGVLYWETNGKIDRTYGLRKISKKAERMIFPTADK